MIEIKNKQVRMGSLVVGCSFCYNNIIEKGGTVYEDHTFVRPSPGEAGA